MATVRNKSILFTSYMENVISRYKKLGKIRTAEAYASSMRSFMRFCKGNLPKLENINSIMIMEYEAYLKKCNVCSNSSSFYMRNLRAVYNMGVEEKNIKQKNPFKHVYTGVEKTLKRGLSNNDMRRIREIQLNEYPKLNYARDMFMFSFYTRGMSFIDMAYLKKKDLYNGILSYRRRKTGQQLFIKYEECMNEIIMKYNNTDSEYILPILKTGTGNETRKQYIYAAHNINRNLKTLGKLLELPVPLTMYVARHSWASIAKNSNIPLSIISEGMGHDSEKTTRIYLATLDNHGIDDANSLIIKSI